MASATISSGSLLSDQGNPGPSARRNAAQSTPGPDLSELTLAIAHRSPWIAACLGVPVDPIAAVTAAGISAARLATDEGPNGRNKSQVASGDLVMPPRRIPA